MDFSSDVAAGVPRGKTWLGFLEALKPETSSKMSIGVARPNMGIWLGVQYLRNPMFLCFVSFFPMSLEIMLKGHIPISSLDM